MRVVVPRETAAGERRVAVVPDAVGRLAALGTEVVVESGAGAAAQLPDTAYAERGATVVADRAAVLRTAQVLLSVQPLPPADAEQLAPGVVTVSFLQPWAHEQQVGALALAHATSFSLDLVPRISRAQPMDALSSQALVAGYHAVIVAASQAPRLFPLFMTAAGTLPPAKVLVLGAGVAGLQAIATARRLGAVVSAYDVRSASAEEVRSLGATFLDLGLQTHEGEGGYARVQSAEFLAEQRRILGEHVAAADVVITTAAVPGRPAPRLVTAEMVRAMRSGSVIVDLGAEGGGNCELTRTGETFSVGGVDVVGIRDAASAYPLAASNLLSRNLVSLLGLLIRDGRIEPDWDDEVVSASCVVRDGTVVAR